MATYILKTHEIEATGNGGWQPEYIKEVYRNESDARRMADYWKYEHRMEVTTQENYVECPMIDGVVFVPDSIQ